MELPFELKIRDMELKPEVQDEIKDKAARLEHFYDRITRCRVTVEGPGRHHRKGHYAVKIDLTVPGGEIVVSKEDTEDVHVAMKAAFEAAKRRLEEFVRKRRGEVKSHEA
jgi:ribosomal subunit interface protein